MPTNDNPYNKGTMSHKIYENNYKTPGELIFSAGPRDKRIIYLYVMGGTIKRISEEVDLSISTINTVLSKYGVN